LQNGVAFLKNLHIRINICLGFLCRSDMIFAV
jgi:hypothetical protein